MRRDLVFPLVVLLVGSCAQRGAEEPVGTTRSALTDVTWTDVVGVSASGNSLTKTGGPGWNAGAASNETLTGDGYAELTTAEATSDKVVGLSHADPAQSYAAVDFGIDLTGGGGVNVIEDGAFVFTGGTYAASDVFRVQVAGTQVTYLQNGKLFYTSTKTPTLPLLVGAVLYETGTTVDNVTLSAGSWQDAVGVTTSGASMTKTGGAGWNAGAVSIGSLPGDGYAQFTTAEATTDKVAGLSHADPAQSYAAIDFGIDLTSGGAVHIVEDGLFVSSSGAYAAADVFEIQVSGAQVTYLQNGKQLYASTKTPTQPLRFGTSIYTTGATINGVALVPGSLVWQDVVGLTTSGASMTKTGAAGWNAGAASLASLSSSGYARFTTAEATTDKVAGLSHADPAQSFAAVDFGIDLTSGGAVGVIEDGSSVFKGGTYVAGDVFEIQASATQVTYLQNGKLFYTSTKAPTLPLLFGTSLYSTGATIDGVALASGLWQDAVGVTTSGWSMTKTGGPGWNAGAATFWTLGGDGTLQFTTAESTTDKVAGLSHADPAQSYAAIDFGLDLTSGGGVNVIEDGGLVFSGGTYAAGDAFTIQVASSVVTYLQNGKLLHTSARTPTFPLLFGTSLYTPGATINSVTPSCSAGTTLCGATCANTASDANNCGGCGVVCAGTCTSGSCLTTLATGQQGGVQSMALDANNVYWTTGGSTGSVLSCAIGGCGGKPTVIAASQANPLGVAVNATTVYWTNQRGLGVMACPLGGCGTPTLVGSDSSGPEAIALDATSVYWLDTGNASGNVLKCPLGANDCNPTFLASGLEAPGLLVVDATSVYWTDPNAGTVSKCAIGGCNGAPTQIASGQTGVRGIAVDATRVYWTTNTTVMTCAIGGCGGAPTQIASGQDTASGIAVDSANVYWLNYGTGTVMKCAIGGCGGAPTQIASGQTYAVTLAVDATSLYWSTNYGSNSVMKLTPK